MSLTKLEPAKEKLLLKIVAGAAALLCWVFFFFLPQVRVWGERRSQCAELAHRVQDRRLRLEQRPVLEEEIARLTKEYGSAMATLPPDEQLPQLLEAIAQMARRSQVHFYGAKPESDIHKLAPGPSGYLEPRILVAGMGGFHEIGAFIDALEQSEHLIRVQELFVLGHDPKDVSQHALVILLQAYIAPEGVG